MFVIASIHLRQPLANPIFARRVKWQQTKQLEKMRISFNF